MARKTMFDDGFFSYLVEGASFVGCAGIPMLMDTNNAQEPLALWPFERRNLTTDKRRYIHFYQHDRVFSSILGHADRYIHQLQLYDGVITPDFSIAIGQSRCLQEANTYMNRAVGYYLQKHGIPVIPNIRWGDKSSYDFCFLGVPQERIVAVSTHGCIQTKLQKQQFKDGLAAMLDTLRPSLVLVHGYMPDSVFGEYQRQVPFHRYPSRFEETHHKGGDTNGFI